MILIWLTNSERTGGGALVTHRLFSHLRMPTAWLLDPHDLTYFSLAAFRFALVAPVLVVCVGARGNEERNDRFD